MWFSLQYLQKIVSRCCGYPQHTFLLGRKYSPSERKILVFWDVTLRSGVDRSRLSEITYCLHFEGLRIPGLLTFQPLKVKFSVVYY
jgi:hypothetical protein